MNKQDLPVLYIALPILNESELLPRLMDCILHQDYQSFRVFACVNQPDEWWEIPDKRAICEANLQTLCYLEEFSGSDITVIDRCTPGNGWKGKRHGVGWARKTVMDAIERVARDQDIIISLDADTTFSEHYFSSVTGNFASHPEAVALAVPYFHKLTGREDADRAILRYEIYMRYYSLNLWRISSPYTFTALGSAMAFPVWAYRAIGGMTPKMSGEDFYFLQKMRKYGKMLFNNTEKVYPAARFSDRVYFGTGPAMIKGNMGDWSSYPVYASHLFDELKMTTDLFEEFFFRTGSTPVVEFLRNLLKEEDPFLPLRQNARDPKTFIRACHEKFDGLRILQYLKNRQQDTTGTDEDHLSAFMRKYYPAETEEMKIDLAAISFKRSPLKELDQIRLFLMKKEEEYQVTSGLL
ncbi:MAG: hypothetical protein NTU98_11755 [Bacteroidetes bacterium]|nr:hypothetical protein [Bacteroidota bacterium]